MTKLISPLPDDGDADDTRLSAPSDVDQTRLATGAASKTAPSSGWLSSSAAIDHGRFPPGTLLGNRYRIVGRLGRGGMGEVFRADDLKLGQQVALKFLPPEVDRDPARLTQLHTEVRMARQVSHPNVCRVYDIDEIEGHTFLSMEYVDGEDLASLLRRIGRFPQDRGLEIARQICAGLAAAHERGVVHRDFKPANVMLDGTGRARITDFGLAGAAGETIRAGTPAYMAPEQLAGGEVTARSDIYALGLVLYELFTGKRALEASSLAELIRRREQAEIAPPSSLVRDLGPEIDRAVMRCLASDPAARPASALQIAAALPGGDPLAAALAAGETPSPQMVAAAGDEVVLSRGTGIGLFIAVIVGLITVSVMADRVLLVGRVALDRSADVLEFRAKELLTSLGYTDKPADTARGAGVDSEQLSWMARTDSSHDRWRPLEQERPAIRFWYRGSPRPLQPLTNAWRPGLNDPPGVISGMSAVVLDQAGRLQELVVVPPQLDLSERTSDAIDWRPLFAAAGLRLEDFTPVPPQWTPRVYAEGRQAWEGPMPGHPTGRLRVEAASYGGKPSAFQVIWPWTRPVRMDAPDVTTAGRILSVAGAIFLAILMTGAVALARHNMQSGRADRRGAGRVAVVLLCIWVAAWALGAKHALSLDAELNLFLVAVSIALLNVGFTWLFYLALEPFVRRYCPEILISWTRLLDGRFSDARVGRDVLVGIACGLFVVVVSTGFALVISLLTAGPPPPPRVSSLDFLMGSRFVVSALLRTMPNAIQGAMIGTFAYVVLLGLTGRRRWLARGGAFTLFVLIVLAESGGRDIVGNMLFAIVVGGPVVFVFLRYGLLAITAVLVTTQTLNTVPMTANPAQPHAFASMLAIALLLGAAAWAFRASRAGAGLFGRLLPA